ncbi:MAG: class A beta-lactamase-related serine hydrolase [Candidatus Omnitrophica bacterium]|nr:class A beta-lactamase-related serine hydrolase [Candidatus Omnitrophota bacterium]
MEKERTKVCLKTVALKIFFSLLSIFLISFLITISTTPSINLAQKNKLYQKLKKQINRKILSLDFEAAYLIKDLDFYNLKISEKENKLFPAASLIKLPILAVSFFAIEEERISLQTTIIIQKKDIVGGSGILKTKAVPIKLTFEELLEAMILYSDNTATNKIIDILGIDYLNSVFKKIGLKHTYLKRKMMDFSKRKKGVENYTSISDIAYLFEKIYNRKLFNEKYSKLALTYLLNQKINDRLPKYLPPQAKVAHKTGLERGVVHDAGIVFTPKGNYLICIFTKNVKKFKNAKEFIAVLSKLTYNYYQLY